MPREKLENALEKHRLGRLDEAESAYREIVQSESSNADAWQLLGMLLAQTGRQQQALSMLKKSVELAPTVAEFHSNLAALLGSLGLHDHALRHCRDAVRLDNKSARALSNLGVALERSGNLEEAVSAFATAIELEPTFSTAATHLGNALRKLGRLHASVQAHERAIRIRGSPQAYNDLAETFLDLGEQDKAVECLRTALALDPRAARTRSNFIYGLLHKAGVDSTELFAESKNWEAVHTAGISSRQWTDRGAETAGRRLRLGYVSPDLREHPVARFIEPILAHHDRGRFEIHCFSDVLEPDRITSRLRSLVEVWHDVGQYSDERLTHLIENAGVDVLVDLAGHTGHNRLLVFARRPAPVQISYLGYPGTTGLSTIQWRITDAIADPPSADAFYTERLIRIPGCAWCYQPSSGSPPISPLPAATRGFVTFAALHRPMKITATITSLWREILRGVPESRLVLSARMPEAENGVREKLIDDGIEASRIRVLRRTSHDQYLAAYRETDIALDTCPYYGTTTTCDALWMGVPVVTLDATRAARTAVSLLSGVGLEGLIAHSPSEYVQIAVTLAGDLDLLSGIRTSLRNQMRESILTDAHQLTRKLEYAYLVASKL